MTMIKNGKASFANKPQRKKSLPTRKKVLPLVGVVCVIVLSLKLIITQSTFKRQKYDDRTSTSTSSKGMTKTTTTVATTRTDNATSSQCWLKEAFDRDDFVVYSHRSFVSNSDQNQPSCKEALSELRKTKVNHVDLDLVFDENNTNNNDEPTIYVSHPMEFKKESSYYSPCSMTPLHQLIPLLDNEYGSGKWFFSLEPKASWGRTDKEINDVALVEPLKMMTALLKILDQFKLKNSQCAVIIDANTVTGSDEVNMFEQLLKHCQLFNGKRNTDIVDSTLDVGVYRYDKIMPTIEFHPDHAGNKGLTVPENILQDSIFWVVDNADDLLLAAKLTPSGIVSNKPKEIVSIITSEAWCEQ